MTPPLADGEECGPRGLLLVDKPEGPTSHDVVASVRRALGGARCGHAGTLDPFASGLLLVAVGSATRVLRFLSGSDKTYEGRVRLGHATDTDDRTGRPLGPTNPVTLLPAALAAAMSGLRGEFDQICPDYSARKHRGVALYKLARRGREVPKRPVPVRVAWHACDIVGPDLLSIHLTVSAGTYIRALARDLGAALGCGGHLDTLRRLGSGPFRVQDALVFPASAETLLGALIPIEAIPLGMPQLTLGEDDARRVRTGMGIPLNSPVHEELTPGWVRILGPQGRLLAVGEIDGGIDAARAADPGDEGADGGKVHAGDPSSPSPGIGRDAGPPPTGAAALNSCGASGSRPVDGSAPALPGSTAASPGGSPASTGGSQATSGGARRSGESPENRPAAPGPGGHAASPGCVAAAPQLGLPADRASSSPRGGSALGQAGSPSRQTGRWLRPRIVL